MMEGLNVFAVEKVTVLDFSWLAVVFTAFVLGVVAITAVVKYGSAISVSKKKLILVTFIIWIIATLVFGLVTGIIFGLKKETRYTVTIDPHVPYVEFTDKYEVIEHTGSLYVIRDRVSD